MSCAGCADPDPERAWKQRGTLDRSPSLVDDSHFIVAVLTCRACSQRFVSVFCETIAWGGGDDPQTWLLVPCSDAELGAVDAATIEQTLTSWPGRRHLVRASRTDGYDTFWSDGAVNVPPHD